MSDDEQRDLFQGADVYRPPERIAVPLRPHAHGRTYQAEHDEARLSSQLARVRHLMRDGTWRTLRELGDEVRGSEASLSARLRDLRKPEYGGWVVERRRRGRPSSGLFEYKVSR